ncbi:hypothetical protein KTR10_00380 [Candidatus Kaiserbacteria bacterium]|nr:hypothetical protein [Candidatus Kaiserbacteria bacterium]
MDKRDVWYLATALHKHSREATFGRGSSEWGTIERFGWDRDKKAFVIERDHNFGFSADRIREEHPCGIRTAHDILTVCLCEDMQERFFVSGKDADELVVCDDRLAILSHSGGRAIKRRYPPFMEYRRGSTLLQFYAPDGSIQRISLGESICSSFGKTLANMDSNTILETLEGKKLESVE